jgi:hypothetical protein
MSDADSSTEFFEFDPSGATTVVRFPLDAERAENLLREYAAAGHVPQMDLIDEIHILVSPEAIKRAHDAIPIPRTSAQS